MAFTKTNENQSESVTNDATLTTTLTANVGDFIYVVVYWTEGPTTITSVADPTNGNYTSKLAVEYNGNTRKIQQFYFVNSASLAGATITVTFPSNSTRKKMYCAAWSGADTVAGFDVENGVETVNPGTGNDAVTSNAATTTAADLIIAASADTDGTATPYTSAGTGFTFDLQNYSDNNFDRISVEHLVQGAAGSQAGTFTSNVGATHTFETLMMAVKPAAAGGAVRIGRV